MCLDKTLKEILLWKEPTKEFLSKLEPPRDSRYAYRLVETILPGLTETKPIKQIVDKANESDIWNYFDARVLLTNDDNEGRPTGSIFVNDIFMSQRRYSVVFQIYIVPWAELHLIYDNHSIGIFMMLGELE